MAYTLHNEWTDGTFEEQPVATFANKRTALRVAKHIAATATAECTARILVCTDGEDTVASFKVAA